MRYKDQFRLFRRFFDKWRFTKRLSSNCGNCENGNGGGLSYYHNQGSEPLHYLTIGQLTRRAALLWPDTDAFVSVQTRTRLTFSQADLQASKLAEGFLDLGLVPGDRIGICSPNSTQWFLTALAAAKAGLVLVSMNPAYTRNELQYCLEKVAVRAVVTEESYKTQQYYHMLCDIVPELSSAPHSSKVSCSTLPNFNYVIVVSESSLPGAFRFSDVLERCNNQKNLQEVEKRLRPEYNGNIQFTSGTTGKPKAVPLNHFNLINNAYFVGKRLGLNKKHHKLLAQTPFFHVLGYIVGMLASLNFGTTLVLPSPIFSVPDSCEAIKKEKCTLLIGTPTMYVDLCSHVNRLSAEEQLLHQSPELALSGGALCAPELFRKMRKTFSCDRVVSVYGLTETTAVIFQTESVETEFNMTSTVGRVCEHVEAKVVDSDGMTVPVGTPGELWIRSFNNMIGYWEDSQSTKNMITNDRWLKTGDKFVLLEGGYGQVVGRKKDMIIRGGENISPKEVEEFLITHPAILDAQVYGVTSERLGEEVASSVRLKADCTLTEPEVRDFCRGKITYYKIPKYVEFVDRFPTTGSGKIQKFKLREAMEKKLKSK